MLVVKIELHSAITHEITEIGRMIIANDGTGEGNKGNYDVKLARKGNTDNLKIWKNPQRETKVVGYNRISSPVWDLMAKALKELGFK